MKRVIMLLTIVAWTTGTGLAQTPPTFSASAWGSSAGACSVTNAPNPVTVGPCVASGGCAGGGEYAWSRAGCGATLWSSVSQSVIRGWNSCGGGWWGGGSAGRWVPVYATGPGSSANATVSFAFDSVWTIIRPNTGDGAGGSLNIGAMGAGARVEAVFGYESGPFSYNAYGITGGAIVNATAEALGPNSVRVHGTVSRENVPIPLNQWFDVEFSLNSTLHTGDIGSCIDGAGSCSRTLIHSASFRFADLAFDVPAGVSVNSTAGGIVNNHYVHPTPRGDSSCDGAIDFFDIDPFLMALFNPADYMAEYPACDRLASSDCDANGVVDFFDIDPFLECLFGECP